MKTPAATLTGPPEPNHTWVIVALWIFACGLALGAIVSCASLSGVTYVGQAERPWTGLDTAIEAAREVIREQHPGRPDLEVWSVEVYGEQDYIGGTCADRKTIECTDRVCPMPGDCRWIISVRELHNPITGALIEPAVSGLFWGVCDRMLADRTGAPNGHDIPANEACRAAMDARYYKLRDQLRGGAP